MNFSFDIADESINQLVEKTIKSAFAYTNNDYHNGSLAKAVIVLAQASAERQLKTIDMEGLVHEVVAKYTKGIVEDVVKRKIADLTRLAVKELKDRGELLS